MALHTRAALGERQLLPGVFFSAKKNNVRRLIWQGAGLCRVFAGYAGWGPGQLDREVQQGVWRVVPANPAQVFSQRSDLWKQLSWQVSRLRMRAILHLKHIPDNPLLN